MSLSPEVIQVLIFLGGALVHFLYSRYAAPSSPTTPLPGNLLPGVNVADGLQPVEVLRLIQNFMGLMQQTQATQPLALPPPPADTSAVLADLLHKLIDRQVPPRLVSPPTPPTLTPNQPAATVSAA